MIFRLSIFVAILGNLWLTFLGSLPLVVGQDRPSLPQAMALLSQREFAKAEALLTELLDQEAAVPPTAWLLLGSARLSQKKYEQAKQAFQKAKEIAAIAPAANYQLARVLAAQEQTTAALQQLSIARQAGFADRGPMLADPEWQALQEQQAFQNLLPPLLEGQDLFAEPVTVLHCLTGENSGDEFGWIARRIGDVDGDLTADFVTTAPGFHNHSGKAYVYSGKTGQLLFQRQGPAGSRFGNSGAAAGDVDGDQIPDVLVGGPQSGSGMAELLSGKDGHLLHRHQGRRQGDAFGYKVSGLPDLNHDGHSEYAITATQAHGTGAVMVYSGRDHSVLQEIRGEGQGDLYGSSVLGFGSAQNPLLAVGAPNGGPGQRGVVYVYRWIDGAAQLHFRFENDDQGQNLGLMFLSSPGDLNQDQHPDLYCSDFSSSHSAPGGGRCWVLSGKDGSVLLDIGGKQTGEGLGTSPSDAGDVDHDGTGDLIVGAWQNGEQARSGGKVYLFSGKTETPLASWTCRQVGDTFGFDAVGLGDTNQDGIVDFLLTSAWSPVHGPKTGRVFIIAGPQLKTTSSSADLDSPTPRDAGQSRREAGKNQIP